MLEFRPMTAEDLDDVFQLRVSTIENAITMARLSELGVTPLSLARTLKENAKGWVCIDGDRLAGFVMGDGANGEVSVLAVHGDFEGRGIGKHLMLTVQDWMFSLGHKSLWLMTTPDPNFRAYGFYTSLGWRATGELQDEDEKLVLEKPAA